MSSKWTRLNNRDYLVYGRTRSEIAAALIEYRAFLRDNPDNELCGVLDDAARGLRNGLRERRRVERALVA